MNAETTALTVVERAAVALGSSKAEAELKALALSTQFITGVTNKDGRQECHSAAMKAKEARVNIEKIGKAAREDATAFSKAVIAKEKQLVDLIEPEEKRLIGLRDAFDEKIEAERKAAEEADRARIAAIKSKISEIASAPTSAALLNSIAIKVVIGNLESIEIDDSFAELYGEAVESKAVSLEKLRELHAAKLNAEQVAAQEKADREAEALRLKAEREELDRQRAEQNRQREELARQQKAIDDQRAEQEHIRKEEQERADREAAEKIAAERKASEEKLAAERKEQERIASAPSLAVAEVTNTPPSGSSSPAPEIALAPARSAGEVRAAWPFPKPADHPARNVHQDTAWQIAELLAAMDNEERQLVLHYCERVINQRQQAANA
jgi:hypothetical protein